MYFILRNHSISPFKNQITYSVYKFYKDLKILHIEFPNLVGHSIGCFRFVYNGYKFIFVSYLSFQEEDYKTKYPIPPDEIIVCKNWLIKQKINILVENI